MRQEVHKCNVNVKLRWEEVGYKGNLMERMGDKRNIERWEDEQNYVAMHPFSYLFEFH